MNKEKISLIIISILYILSYLIIFGFLGGQRYYLLYFIWFSYVFWLSYAAKKDGFNILSWRVKRNPIILVLITGFLEISIYFILGLFYGFGYSPYNHTLLGFMFNTLFFALPLFSREFLRSFIIKKSRKNNLFHRFILVSLILGVIAVPLGNYRIFLNGLDIDLLKFIGLQLIPNLVNSLFATYILVIGGPIASISYFLIINGFEWYTPILPQLEWTVSALVNVFIPIFGFIFIERLSILHYLKRVGLVDKSFQIRKSLVPTQLIITLFLTVIILWGSTGLLSVYPSVVVSGSMRPSLDVGDLTIVKSVSLSNIHIGDVIQYYTQDGLTIIHRVTNMGREGGLQYFITKGDANNLADAPVYSMQVRGKVVLSIPKVGWTVIYLKSFVNILYDLILTNLRFSIIILSTAVSIGLWMKRRGLQNMFRGYRRRF